MGYEERRTRTELIILISHSITSTSSVFRNHISEVLEEWTLARSTHYSGSKNSSDHVSWDNSEEGTTYCQGYTGTGAYPITYILCSILFAKTAL